MPRLSVLFVLLATALPLTCEALTSVSQSVPKKTLTAFSSDAELAAWLAKAIPPTRARMEAQMSGGALYSTMPSPAPAAPPKASAADAAKPMSAPAQAEISTAKDSKADSESVTNTQTAGVDEGGIVKVHGDHLVVLRRGRLFTVAVGRNDLQPISMADAYGPGASPSGAWYDEMLISGDTIVVIGYSYERGGTEVGLFSIDRGGQLAHRGTYHLRSNDYYSSRNYASRLIGSKLIFYTPLQIGYPGNGSDPFAGFPAMRRWQGNATPPDFKRIAPATRIYRTDEELPPGNGVTLHSVTTCDLAKAEMSCEASAVIGPAGRVFYVSEKAVYVWTSAYARGGNGAQFKSGVFRMPLDGAAPTALKVAGAPIDQFSFLESPDGYLNVLVRSQGRGDGMWGAEATNGGDVALLRASINSFGDGRDAAPAGSYKLLPKPESGALQNRFVGPYLLYGSGNTWRRPNDMQINHLYAVRWADRSEAQSLPITHSVDRIEALGRHAVIVGTSGSDLMFSSLRLERQATPAYRYTRANAAQGETRSHGFFYKPENDGDGMVGLPIVNPVGAGRPGSRQLREDSAAVLYLRNEDLQLSELGALESRGGSRNDGCRASCVDWYGNARPLFLKNRVFALMGYELVEGRVEQGNIDEIRRVSFAPNARGSSRW